MSTITASAATTDAPAARRTPSEWDRVWRVVRLHYANRMNSLVIPWMIAGVIFAINLIIFGLIVYSTHGHVDLAHDGNQYSGALTYILPYQVVFAVQAINLTFPYALGLSSTRRDYFLGTALMFLMQAAQFTIGFTILSYLEQWTNGWGLNGHVFYTELYGSGSLWHRVLIFFVPLVFVLFAGSVAAAVFVRWRANGLYLLGAGFALAVIGAVALITLSHGWPAIGRWFVQVGPSGLAAWLAVPAVLFAIAGFFVLRRATPKN